MSYAGVQMLMGYLKQLIHCNDIPIINNNPMILSERPQFQLLYQELASIIQTLSIIHQHHHHLEHGLQNLKRRLKDAAEEAQDIIDLFLSAVDFRNRGIYPTSDAFKTSLDLGKVMRSIATIKVELMTTNTENMKMDFSPRIDRLKSLSSAAAGAREPLGMKPLMKEVVVGLDRDVELIRDKLVEDKKQLGVVSIVGMGGLGKTTLATKVFNDRFIVYHFHVRAWVTVSQTYDKQDALIQILASIGVEQGLEKASHSQLREKLHKSLMGRRYLLVIDDIWSSEAWDELKLFFPHHNTGSRILLTSRVNEVALHAKRDGFVHSLPYLTKEESWELLKENVFHGDKCPEWLIKPGMQIAEKCQGLPLSVVVMAGVLAKEKINEDFWEKIASGVGSYIVRDHKGTLKALALSYHHLPHHLRECFLHLGGFPEDSRISVERLIWLWGAEGFIEENGIRSMEDTAKAYLMDLVDRNLVIVAERKFNGDVKACKLHDLVRELCLKKAKEERSFHRIDPPRLSSQLPEVITAYKQRRVFTDQNITFMNFVRPPTPSLRSFLCFHQGICLIDEVAKNFSFFALLRVLDLQNCEFQYYPQGMASLVHLRYLAISYSLCFPSSICNLWSLQTLILKTRNRSTINLPHNISDLVNLRHLWSNVELFIPTTEKPMKLLSISEVRFGDGVDIFAKCFPSIKKLVYTIIPGEEIHFESLLSLETLKLRMLGYFLHNQIWFPATLKKLTLERCFLLWSKMSIIQSLPNLEVLKLKEDAFEGIQWNTGEQQFRQLKVLRIQELDIKHWVVYSTSFPCLKRLAVRSCRNLEAIPLEIGEIATLELIETDSRNYSVVESVKRIQKEQHDEGNTELKITVDGLKLSIYLSEHEGSESEIEISSQCSSDLND